MAINVKSRLFIQLPFQYRNSKILIGLLVLFFSLLLKAAAQTPKIDSLNSIVNLAVGTELCDVLYELAYENIDLDNNKSLEYSTRCIEEAMIFGDSLRLVKGFRIKSLAFRRLGLMDSSFKISARILPIAKRNNFEGELKHIFNGLAMVYLHNSFYDKALKYSFESLALRQKHGSQAEISVALNNIGMVYFKLEDLDRALEYYLKSLEIKEKIRYEYDLDILLINISLCYAYEGKFRSAKKFVDRALAHCNKKCTKAFQMHASFAYGLIHFGLHKFSNAEANFTKSYKIAQEINSEQFQLDNIVYLAQTYIKLNKMHDLKDLAEISESILSSNLSYNQGLIQLYSELISLYESENRFEKVQFYQDKYIALKDSLYNYGFTRNLMRIEVEYMEQENIARIASQNKILNLQNDVIFRQRFSTLFLVIIVVLSAALTIVLYRHNQNRKQTNKILEERVRERTLELEVNEALLQKSLEESGIQMQRVAGDIKRNLATIKGLCHLGLMDKNMPSMTQYINKIDSTSDQLLNILNRIAG